MKRAENFFNCKCEFLIGQKSYENCTILGLVYIHLLPVQIFWIVGQWLVPYKLLVFKLLEYLMILDS